MTEYTGKNWEMIQIAYCRVQEINKCPVSPIEKLGGGSAFVVRDNKTIATNLHNLQPWISAVTANNDWKPEEFKVKLSEIVAPIILMNQNDGQAFSPAAALATGEAYRIKLINDAPALFAPSVNMRSMLFALSDYVELEFKNEFKAPPLRVAESPAADSYFVVGFPGPTNLFAKLGLGDGDGLHQMVSVGVKTDQEMSASPGTALAQAKYFTRITAPTYTGNSGGPVLNKRGEVVGILSSGDLYKELHGKPAYFSEFINILKLDDLQRTWKTGQP